MRKRSQAFFVVSWLLFILLCTLLQNLPLQAASLAPAGTNAVSLTPSEIVARAREWVTAKVPYTQDASAQYRFKNYRTDCSGLVTMAWGIPATRPNYGLSTDTLSSVADSLGKALDSPDQPIMAT